MQNEVLKELLQTYASCLDSQSVKTGLRRLGLKIKDNKQKSTSLPLVLAQH